MTHSNANILHFRRPVLIHPASRVMNSITYQAKDSSRTPPKFHQEYPPKTPSGTIHPSQISSRNIDVSLIFIIRDFLRFPPLSRIPVKPLPLRPPFSFRRTPF
ncbi:hypothetical protein NPIL_647011 [Nephila pilipes]|uniref:Uncharacterized protein n=1 Tax=Nephila pilipes TaxID=299642 RepID=A0A8X6M9J1_NEPPI|nr:hypothetical protein NPIL_647011 [Nephila pilipes]